MPRAQLTKEKVVDAAIELANEIGLEQLSFKDLAAKLTIKPPSLYNHVANLAELHTEIRRRSLESINVIMAQACIGLAGRDALEAFAIKYREFVKEQPSLFYASLESVETSPELRPLGQQVLSSFIAIFQGLELTEEEMIHSIRIYRATIVGFIYLELQGGFGLNVDVDATFEQLLEKI